MFKSVEKVMVWLAVAACKLSMKHQERIERRGNEIFVVCDICQCRTGGWQIEDKRQREGTDRRATEERRGHDRRALPDRRISDRRDEEFADLAEATARRMRGEDLTRGI